MKRKASVKRKKNKKQKTQKPESAGGPDTYSTTLTDQGKSPPAFIDIWTRAVLDAP
jgi:hypothetical protein